MISQDEAILIASREMSLLNPEIFDTVALYYYTHEDSDGRILTNLVWSLKIKEKGNYLQQYCYFIDAHSGKIIDKRSLVKHYGISGYVSGKVKPNDWNENSIDQNLKNIKIAIQANNQEYVIYTNNSGFYNFSVSPQPVGMKFMLKGDNISLSGIAYSEYETVIWGDGQYNYDFGETEGVNILHRLNEMQNYFTDEPYNFSIMSSTNIYPVVNLTADIRAGTGAWALGVYIIYGRKDGAIWGNLADVSFHEYTHGVIYKIYSNNFIYTIATGNDKKYAAAMDEGFPDYFTCSKNSSGQVGEYASAYDGLPRNIQFNGFHFNDLLDYRYNSLVISGACRDLRFNLNDPLHLDEIVFDALQYETTNFEDFVVKLALEHDNDGYLANSIPDWDSFNSAFFSNHGIIFEANVPRPATFTVSISGPGYLNFKQQGTFTANATGGIPFEGEFPYSYSWYKKNDGSSSWTYCGTGSTKQFTMGTTAFTLKVTATDYEGRTTTDTHYVDNSFWKKAPGDGDGKLMVPEEYSLGQNFPNPFNPTTTIKYDLKESGFVRLNIYNVKGQVVKKLINKAQSAGRYEATFDASSLPSGLYYYSLEAGNFKEVRKMILMK